MVTTIYRSIKQSRRRSIMQGVSLALLVLLLGCGPSIPIKFPQYPASTGSQLKRLLKGKRNLGVVAAKPPSYMLRRIGYENDWTATIEAAVSAAITERGYFTIVDIENRKDRLRELAHSQSGLTRESLKIGKELEISNMLIVRMTQPPRAQCTTKMVADYSGYAAQLALAKASGDGAGDAQLKKPTKVLNLTIFVEGKLLSVETGQAVRYANSKSYEYMNSAGDTNCPSALAAFDPALQYAANKLADNLSPKIVTLQVPLMDDVGDDVRGDPDRVAKYLESGNAWAENNDFDAAAKSWKRALSESGRSSLSAMWNLGVYNWYKGNYKEADKYFGKVKGELGPGGLSSSMMFLLTKFREQKNEKKGR